MLSNLKVQNLALIDILEVSFENGFTVLTGETGAGKSILLGAISILLGERAYADDIRTGRDRASVEGTFNISGMERITNKLGNAGIPVEDESLHVRREILSSGKNRVFLNSSACTLGLLKEVGDLLVDIHGQHDHQSLLKPETHLEIIDSFSSVSRSRNQYDIAFRHYSMAAVEVENLLKKEVEIKERLDLFSFRVDEIGRAKVMAKEDDSLEEELKVLESSGKRQALAEKIAGLLSQSENTVEGMLKESAKSASSLAEIDRSVEEMRGMLNNAYVEVSEAARGFEAYARNVESNPARVEEINERLAHLARLKKKYGGTLETVQAEFDRCRKGMEAAENIDAEKREQLAKLEGAKQSLAKRALALSEARKKVVKAFNLQVSDNLKKLSMEAAKFEVRIFSEELPSNGLNVKGKILRFDATGIDLVEMLISPNPGEPLKPLIKIASGGELSRVMLAIKSFLAAHDRVPTLVFDEIDSGIGGKVAVKIGEALSKLSKTHQVLCVTHLPPIAAKAASHYVVNKSVDKGRTSTFISIINKKERVQELARMMGSEESDSTLRHAKELIGAK